MDYCKARYHVGILQAHSKKWTFRYLTLARARRKDAIFFLSIIWRALGIAELESTNMTRAPMNMTAPAVPLDRRARAREAAPPYTNGR